MSVIHRLKKLESYLPSGLILSVSMPDGTIREMSAHEYYEAAKAGASFISVLNGNNLDDLDLILKTICPGIN